MPIVVKSGHLLPGKGISYVWMINLDNPISHEWIRRAYNDLLIRCQDDAIRLHHEQVFCHKVYECQNRMCVRNYDAHLLRDMSG